MWVGFFYSKGRHTFLECQSYMWFKYLVFRADENAWKHVLKIIGKPCDEGCYSSFNLLKFVQFKGTWKSDQIIIMKSQCLGWCIKTHV